MRRNKSVKLYIIIVLVLIIGFMAAGVKIFADRISENSEAGEAAVNIKEIQNRQIAFRAELQARSGQSGSRQI